MIKKVFLGIAMSLAFAISTFATNKIAKFNCPVQKITNGIERTWKSSGFIRLAQDEAAPTADVTLGPTEGYSILSGPDSSQWYATQSFTRQNYYYTASTITLFNHKGEQQGIINVSIPEGQNVNQIIVGDLVSTTLFDKDANTMEIPIIIHTIHSQGKTSYTTYIYDVASGQLKSTYKGRMVVMDYNNGWRTEWLGVLSGDSIVNEQSSVRYDIYTKPGYGSDNATLKHTFTVPKILAEYQIGSVINVFVVDHKPYYVISSYEKEYLDPASYEEPWDMIPTADNNFVVTIYDQNFKETGIVKIPVTSTKQILMQYGIGLLGVNDFSHDFWDESGDMHIVVTTAGFNVVSEAEDISFDVYDLNGNLVKNIASNVADWMKMYDIPGQPIQMAMLSTDGTSMTMLDLPECKTAFEFGNEIEGEAISTAIDRYTVGAGYQYVVALPSPEVDAEKNFIQRFAWITTEGEIAKQVKFNLGQSNASWIPLVMGEVLNPYVFDTDDMREYVFIANQYASGISGKIVDELRIVKEDGTVVRTYKEDATKGDLGTCNILGINGSCPSIIVPYLNSTTDQCTVEIDFLPYSKFSAGGDGTPENPYLISSIGDMAQMSDDLSAHYKVIKDFDAAGFGSWQPTPLFTGTFDGDNHTISNLYIGNETAGASIFAETENAIVKNIRLQYPELHISADATSAGIIASSAISSTFSNITVNDAIIQADSDANTAVGGIVGTASLNSVISECYSANISINTPGASPVGGIVGNTRTSSVINACAASGTIVGSTNVGGIVGEASTSCTVTNCHSTTDISGRNTIGGIVGNADRGGIHACIAEGSLTANEPGFNDYIRAGGIAGYLAPSYTETSAESQDTVDPWNGMVVSCNVVNMANFDATGKAAHRIIGYSRWDEDVEAQKYDATVELTMDNAIDKNFALNPADAIDSSGTVAAAENTTEGLTIAGEDFTADFLASLNFKFGESGDAPWSHRDDSFALYFETDNQSSIDEIAAEENAIIYDGNEIRANAETKIEIFNLSGIKIASGFGKVSAARIPQGIYVATTTDASGVKHTAKIAIR